MQNQGFSQRMTAISPSLVFEAKRKKSQIKQFFGNLKFWHRQHFHFNLDESKPIQIHYNGSPEHKPMLMALLGTKNPITITSVSTNHPIYIADHFIHGAIRVPFFLSTIVKLGRPVEDVVASYSKSLRRSIAAERPSYRHQTINSVEKIDLIEQGMLKPYAAVRHGDGTYQLAPGVVREYALSKGRLDLLLQGDEEVGCNLGNPYTRKGKRYWHVHRLGYTSSVFNDFKRWGEVNSINLHLALESSITNGYDYCDYGISLAKPGHGLIEWKRRRRGFLATHDNFDYFYVKLPKTGGAQFLWETPLFGVEGDKPTLHLGIPADKTEEEILARYHEMGYGGLYKVYLSCVKQPSEQFIASISALYADQETQPIVVTKVVG